MFSLKNVTHLPSTFGGTTVGLLWHTVWTSFGCSCTVVPSKANIGSWAPGLAFAILGILYGPKAPQLAPPAAG